MGEHSANHTMSIQVGSRWRPLLVLTIVISSALVLGWASTRSEYLFTSDNGMKLLQVKNLTSAKPSLYLTYPGQALVEDPHFAPFTGHAVYKEGHWYSVFPLPYALLDVPFYRLFGSDGLHIVPSLSVIAVALIMYQFSNFFLDRQRAFVVSVLTALGSPLFFYGLVNWEHATATALITASVLFVCSGLQSDRMGRILASGSMVGVACWMRPEAYVFLAIGTMGLFAVAKHGRSRKLAHYLAGAVLAILPLLAFNTLTYGNLLGPQVAYNYGSLALADVIPRWIRIRPEVLGAFFPTTSKRWLTAYSVIVATVLLLGLVPSSKRSAYRLVGIEISILIAVGLTLDYLRNPWRIYSLVEASPWMVLVPWVWATPSEVRRSGRPWLAGTLLSTAFTLLTIVLSPVPGGDQWGGRLFLLVVPIWVLLSVHAYDTFSTYVTVHRSDSIHRLLLPAAFYALATMSLCVQAASVQELSKAKASWASLGHSVAELPHESVLATNTWWVPLVLAPDFYDYRMLHVSSDDDLCRLASVLLRSGVSSVYVITTPELLMTPSRLCSVGSARLKELSRRTVDLWITVQIQEYAILPVDP